MSHPETDRPVGQPWSRLPRSLWLAWLLCISHGLLFVITTPLWEGWDEAFHYSYIQILAEDESFPVYGQSIVSREIARSFDYAPLSYASNLNVGQNHTKFADYWNLPIAERLRRQQELRAIPVAEAKMLPDPLNRYRSYEAHHGPLYYLLSVSAYRAFSSSNVPARATALRLFSLLLGSITIFLAFAITRYVSREPRHLIVVPLLLALLPLLYPTIGRISNDSLGVTLFSALVWSVLRYFARSCKVRDAFLIGAILASGLLTKAYFLAAIPAMIMIFAAAFWAGRERSRLALHCCLIGGLVVLIAGWWFARNYSLYGNISGMQELTANASLSLIDRLGAIREVPWYTSIKGMLRQHIWVGNTSALSLPRGMYQLGYGIILLSIGGALAGALAAIKRHGSMLLTEVRTQRIFIVVAFYSFFAAGVLYHMLVNYLLIKMPGGTGGWYLYAAIVPEILLLLFGIEWLAGKYAAASNAFVILYVLTAGLLAAFSCSLPSYAGFFISSFNVFELIRIYGPSNFHTVLENLALNKPEFVTPSVIGTSIVIDVALVVAALFDSRNSTERN
jgi:hypothetical protein